MTISNDELNYLIWRYLQEQGLEISLFALKDETKIDRFDLKYNDKIPLGCLINLIQKGILYCEEDELVDLSGIINSQMSNKFNLFDALEKDKLNNPTTNLKLSNSPILKPKILINNTDSNDVKEVSPTLSDSSFTSVLINSFSYPKSQSVSWNPLSSAVLAWGQRDNTSIILVLDESQDKVKLVSTLKLEHPYLASDNAENDITLLKWSLKGDMLLTASEMGELRLWTTDGKLKNVMMLHNSAIITIKWLLDLILTKDQRRTIVWDSKTGLALLHLEDTQGGIDCCFIDESKIAVPGQDYSVSIYDFTSTSNTPISNLHGHTDNISFMDYSTTLKLLVTVSDDLTIRIWKGDSINPAQIIWAHSQLITSCNWLPLTQFAIENIEMLISTSLDGTIRIWNIFTGDLLFVGSNSISILQAELSPDNHWLATGDVDGIVTIWDVSITTLNQVYKRTVSSGTIVGNLKNKSQYQPDEEIDGNFISCISWSEDSKKIAVSYSEIDSVVLYI